MAHSDGWVETEHGWMPRMLSRLYEQPERTAEPVRPAMTPEELAEQQKFHEFYLWRRARSERTMAEIEQTHGRAAAAASAAAGVSADVFRAFQKGLSNG